MRYKLQLDKYKHGRFYFLIHLLDINTIPSLIKSLQMANFTESAQGLARNPLGIIALFISFVYALACLVIGVSTRNLTIDERLPLVYFVILFPVVTLLCFMWLVIYHSNKLYAPSDYKDDKNFMDTIGIPEKMKRFSSAEKVVKDEEKDAIESLLIYSSPIGIFALYAVYLAYEHKKSFTLEALSTHCELLNPDYTHGYLVAASTTGAFNFSTTSEPFLVAYLDDKIKENIVARLSSLIERDHPSSEYLENQRKDLETAFTTVNTDEKSD